MTNKEKAMATYEAIQKRKEIKAIKKRKADKLAIAYEIDRIKRGSYLKKKNRKMFNGCHK